MAYNDYNDGHTQGCLDYHRNQDVFMRYTADGSSFSAGYWDGWWYSRQRDCNGEQGWHKEEEREMIGQTYSRYKIKYNQRKDCYYVQGFYWTHRWVNVATFDTRFQAQNYIAEQEKGGSN
jgi:hypothetical protein